MRVNKWIIGIIFVVVLLIGFRLFESYQKSQVKPAAVEKQIPVRIEAVSEHTIQDLVVLTGSINPESLVPVASKVSGRILTLPVSEGQEVYAGQVLATIETTELEHSLRSAEQGLLMANANYENARINLERYQKLYQDGVISQQQLEVMKLQYTAAETAKNNAEINLSLIRSEMGASSGSPGNAKYSRLTAPVSGIILKKYAEVGALIGPASPTPVVTIGVINRLKIQVNAEEKLLPYLKRGQTVQITVDAWPDQVFSGRISSILPQIDPVTRSITLEISVDNKAHKLLPGMFAKVKLARRAVNQVIAVPLKSVLEDEQGKYVYLYENGKAVLRRVQTGLADEELIQITAGLKPGESIIIAGQHSVENGSRVEDVGGKS